jgi:hypothetical protein
VQSTLAMNLTSLKSAGSNMFATTSELNRIMHRYFLTLIGLAIAVIVFGVSIYFEIDLFEKMVASLHDIEKYEVDEFLVSLFVFVIFALIDDARRNRLKRIEAEKVKVYRAMLDSSNHVLNSFLHKMQLFKMTAENYIGFPQEVLKIYDNIFETAIVQMEALSKVKQLDEKSITQSVLNNKSIS